MTNVMIGLVAGDFERRIAGHFEGLSGAVVLPLAVAFETNPAGTADAFHDFGCTRVECQRCRQNNAHGFFGTVGKLHGMADAFAVEVDAVSYTHLRAHE